LKHRSSKPASCSLDESYVYKAAEHPLADVNEPDQDASDAVSTDYMQYNRKMVSASTVGEPAGSESNQEPVIRKHARLGICRDGRVH
jgi:hypothetical protein